MNTQTSEITLASIESAARDFSVAREVLSERVQTLESQLESLKRAALPGIKRALAVAAEKEQALKSLIDQSHHLFVRPRTVVMHGIKLGLRKGTGGIEWDDDARVILLIRKHFPKAQADLLIKTTEKPIAKALADLDVPTLKKLGCRVEETGDTILIKPVDGEVEKIVSALLKDATSDEQSRDREGASRQAA